MTIIEEVEQIIAQLPAEQAYRLRFWLNEFKAARRYKQLKAESKASQFDALTIKALDQDLDFPRG